MPKLQPLLRVGVVRLTVGQIEALESLCAYASAGGPEDVGMEQAAYDRLNNAWQRLADARGVALRGSDA